MANFGFTIVNESASKPALRPSDRPGKLVATAYYMVFGELELRTGIFDAITPIGDVFHWAMNAKFDKTLAVDPLRIVITAGEEIASEQAIIAQE